MFVLAGVATGIWGSAAGAIAAARRDRAACAILFEESESPL
ncbi:MAG: hypothetical protein O3C67_07545 [Cyanobacteria bacterium]|nr:hypothetical protein [Cyanobacteriota bacterium]MEB3266968.1 hypothetical protein [Leptolyngbya sp.]